jgi:tRNA pseudouridine38-40 synthase
MPRYRLTVEYDGGPYRGFQAQANGPSVQAAIEVAVHRFCGETLRIAAAGRTDAGVHALGQVVHLDLEKDWPAATVMNAINAHLVPQPIAVVSSEIAAPDFHARFSAKGRRYRYRILNRSGPAALDRGHIWHIKQPLAVERMAQAAACLIGLHDFTTFRDAACQARSPVKTLDEARVSAPGDEVRLEFAARSFLHRQVRSMVGSLAQVGLGRWSPSDFAVALEACDRTACGPVAPADGLYLVSVEY